MAPRRRGGVVRPDTPAREGSRPCRPMPPLRLRDPVQTELDTSYASNVELSREAADTRYHTNGFRVFINEPEAEQAIHAQTVDGFERWPGTTAGCA